MRFEFIPGMDSDFAGVECTDNRTGRERLEWAVEVFFELSGKLPLFTYVSAKDVYPQRVAGLTIATHPRVPHGVFILGVREWQ
jgi:hypothetical protein